MINFYDCFMYGTWPDDDQTETSEGKSVLQQRDISEKHEGMYFFYIKPYPKCNGITFGHT